MKRPLLRGLILAAALAIGLPAHAAGPAIELPQQKWSMSGPFGTFDRAAAQRGLQVYKEVCSACHAMRLVAYRNLAEIGLSEDEVKAFAAGFQVKAGPNDQGEMFERAALPSDRFRSPFPNELAARAANNGAYPLDLSVITKARKDGWNYLHALMIGYSDPPEGTTMMAGMHYNRYFSGNQIAMAAPLMDDRVTYADGTKATVDQMARDVTVFLAWAAEPELEVRRALGVKIILFLLVLTVLAYLVKKKIWADVKH
jgi:ubiquinol-cytochrome c reductase cytochrome c1 subunit